MSIFYNPGINAVPTRMELDIYNKYEKQFDIYEDGEFHLLGIPKNKDNDKALLLIFKNNRNESDVCMENYYAITISYKFVKFNQENHPVLDGFGIFESNANI